MRGPVPEVLLCTGKHCRGTDAHRKLTALLGQGADVIEVGCQSVCDGPVCGVRMNGELTWFDDLSGRRTREALRSLLTTGEMRRRLRSRVVAKRTGKRR
jgi:hypothetical protein